MDFNSLIGTSAYVAKQLELKWFYQWELTSQRDGGDAPKGRLVRKRHHSMPFLHRNIIAHRNSWDGKRSQHHSSAAGLRDEFDIHEFATSKLPASARTKQRPKRKMVEEVEESSSYQAKGKTKKRNKRDNNDDNVVAISHKKSNDQQKKFASTFSNTTSLHLHLQNPIERKKIIDQVPKELHHDETYILERMKESWLRNNNKYDMKDEISTNNGGDTINPLSSNWESIILPPDVAFTSLKKVKANDGPKSSAGSNTRQPSEQLTPAYLHYIYMQPNNIPATIVEEINGRMCPFCNFDGGSNEGLISHCGIYHGTLLETNDNQIRMSVAKGRDGPVFEAVLGEEKQLHIVLRGEDPILPAQQVPAVDNFIFIQPRYVHNQESNKQQIMNVPYLQRLHSKTASLDAATRNKKLMTLQANDAPARAISAYLPTDTVPLRQYYHASTNLPMTHSDWMKDSDEETDETWLHEMQSELLDEFEDVSPKEKQFMKLWNRYIKCNHVIADKDMPMKCHLFTLEYRKQLMDGGMRLNFLLHLFNLWDSGVISSARILSCMALFDEAGNENKKDKKGRRSSNLATSSECVTS